MSVQPQLRRRKPLLKAVEEIDAFPKVPETCLETTSYGGTGEEEYPIFHIKFVAEIVILMIILCSIFGRPHHHCVADDPGDSSLFGY